MKFYLGIAYFFVFFTSGSNADEYFFKKIADENSAPELIGKLTLSESKRIAVEEGMLHNKIIFDGSLLTIPGVCKVNMRSDLPKKRGQSDLDSIHHVKENVGDDGEYKKVRDEDIDFITRSEPLLGEESECDFLYHFAIKIDKDIIFNNNGWSVIYTSNNKNPIPSVLDSEKEQYKIGSITCTVIRNNDDYERSDRCTYNGTLDSAYQQFYINSVNEGHGWSDLKPSYKEVLSILLSKKDNEFTTTPLRKNNSGEISIKYSMPTKNSIKLLSSMEGGETLVSFEEDKGMVNIEINSSPD